MKKKRGVIFAAGLVLFVLLAILMVTGNLQWFDDPIREWVYSIRNPALTEVLKVITYMGNWQTITLLCIVLLLFRKTRLRYGVPVSAGAIFVTIFNRIIKLIFKRPRPEESLHLIEEGGYSFTSGHSITSMVVFGLLIYLVRKYVRNRKAANILTAALAVPWIFIGLSRIYMGVHFPSDVLAGWALGAAVLVGIIVIVEKCDARRKQKIQ
ncbi:phosphatase PAP2 family protein [Zhenpiania hominis]|uniref:phosphatase PAP2 family protein n=1 Tax=Zhenpiania hominis TaxID=2763644 RepID=UPI0039F54771